MAFDLATRILEGDSSIWGPESLAPNRLGWLNSCDKTGEYLDDLERWSDGVDQSKILVVGMGGSGLGPRVYADFCKYTLKSMKREISVIDSTDPRGFADIDLSDTAVVVSSKSGTTLETEALFRFFYSRMPNPKRFYAITDSGTRLETIAKELGFKRIFTTPQNVGGRFSIFTEFGLVPAALLGLDVAELLTAAKKLDLENWVQLGETLGANANTGTNFVNVLYGQDSLRSAAMWTEQILAESTGKGGKGLIPVTTLNPSKQYNASTITIQIESLSDLASHLYGMQFAAAAAGYALGVDPFNEPDVEVSKAITRRILDGEKVNLGLEITSDDYLADHFNDRLSSGGYGSISSYQPLNSEDALYDTQAALSLKVTSNPITVGLAPRHLHATGQLHKGGPKKLSMVQIISANYGDKVRVPEMDTDFGTLIRAQADGDALALVQYGQKVARIIR